jgi:hypothetical protein
MLYSGTELFGSIDRVPGICHVATRFDHVFLFPFIPSRSYLLLWPVRGRKARGIRIRMRWRSVFLAWGRGLLLTTSVVCIFLTVIFAAAAEQRRAREADDTISERIGWEDPALVFAVAFSVFLSSYLPAFTRANFERAIELGQIFGLDEPTMKRIYEIYGRPLPRRPIVTGVPGPEIEVVKLHDGWTV